jgi:hypothetical protein
MDITMIRMSTPSGIGTNDESRNERRNRPGAPSATPNPRTQSMNRDILLSVD